MRSAPRGTGPSAVTLYPAPTITSWSYFSSLAHPRRHSSSGDHVIIGRGSAFSLASRPDFFAPADLVPRFPPVPPLRCPLSPPASPTTVSLYRLFALFLPPAGAGGSALVFRCISLVRRIVWPAYLGPYKQSCAKHSLRIHCPRITIINRPSTIDLRPLATPAV
jgi:hypothetical protein